MRVDRNRRYRVRPVQVGPSIVRKVIIPEDTCGIFFDIHPSIPDPRPHSNTTFTQPDRYGIDGYDVPYSLNKKERWTIPERLKEDIEDLQKPRHNLRVSVVAHEFDRVDHRGLAMMESEASQRSIRNKPARSFHTVSRDGKTVTNNYAKKRQARLQTLINPKGLKPFDFRKDLWKRKKQQETDHENLVDKLYLPDEGVADQKLHVLYSTVEMTSKASSYNKFPKDKKASKKRGTVARKNHGWMLEPLSESDQEQDEDEDEPFSATATTPVAPSLFSFLVSSPSKHGHPRRLRSKKESFKDESYRSSSLSLVSEEILDESSTEEKDVEEVTEDVVIVESPSRIVMVTALPQLFTKIRLQETQLTSLPSLSVYPRSWEVHSDATERVLGRAFPICIVAKEMTDGEIGLFGHEDCLSCSDRCGRFNALFEDSCGQDAEPSYHKMQQSASCNICCREMALDALSEYSRPFALTCGHSSCTGCWLQTISDGIKKRRVPVTCPDSSCTLTLSIRAASALLDSYSLRKYTEELAEVLMRQQKIVRCRDCSRLHRVVISKPSVRCVCGTSICARCSSVAHSPVSCRDFRDYCNFMQTNGLSSTHVSSVDAPIVRNLSQCPKCGILAEPQWEWCRNLFCLCGERFCHRCSMKWTDAHYDCEIEDKFKSWTMIDVSTSRSSELQPTMLSLSIASRLSYFEKRKEVMDRLQSLPINVRTEFDKIFTRLSHLMEICYLNSPKSKRSLVLAERIQFAMCYFFNTEDKNGRNLMRKTELLRKILNEISTELFGGVSGVHRKK